MKKLQIALVSIFILSAVISCSDNNIRIKYSVTDQPWAEEYGNHRAILEVSEAADAVELDFLWRRHDKEPEEKRLLIINSETGDTVQNIHRLDITNEKCHLVFGPVETPGLYHFYYLPYAVQEGYGFYYKGHLIPEEEPDQEWLERNKLNIPETSNDLPSASCTEIQARTEFDSFYPMEVIATEEEKDSFIEENDQDYYLFPEDRVFPIRMKDNIPYKWIKSGLKKEFKSRALKNEYYVFQVGVWAAKNDIENLEVDWSELISGGKKISADMITCFNTEGINPDGKYFNKEINITKGEVQALWFGVDIPEDISPGKYIGKIRVAGANIESGEVIIEIKVGSQTLADRGDSELWRHSRLRWLNSTAGIDKKPVSPFTEIKKLGEKSFSTSGSQIIISENGLPRQIAAYGREILASEIELEISTSKSKITSGLFNKVDEKLHPGEVNSEFECNNKELLVHSSTRIEFDGYLAYNFTIRAKENLNIEDVKLNIPLKQDIAEYMMGMGLPGTEVPDSHTAKWEGPHDSFWIGNTYGGIHCELRGSDYHGPLLNLYKPAPPDSWHNGGLGGFSITKKGEAIVAGVSSGKRQLKEGEEINFEFALLITPIHKLDPKGQFTDRYYHNGGDPAPEIEELEAGVKIINLHHANEYNPHINYPFIATDEMKGFVDKYHSYDKKVKIYYTIRELTNWVTEIWAIRSLGNEILEEGRGGGFPWLREHFVDGYTPQWYQRLDSLKVDASVLTSTGESRWYNYYIEGLGWLVENMDIDGLYLDDVSFDRRMMKRIRKVMEGRKPGCILDLHSNTGFSKGPATQYTEFFPYVDKLWFGESFQYDEMPPANWLVEVSGIPFGLMGDMLHGGGNPWRGMIYGMTVRYPWTTEGVTCNPIDIWKVWDDFDIANAEMRGYWDEKCEIKTDNQDVLLTYYQHQDKILLSIASWADEAVNIRIKADWEKLGFDPDKIEFKAPEIKNFQPEANFKPEDLIPVEPKKGWLLVLDVPTP